MAVGSVKCKTAIPRPQPAGLTTEEFVTTDELVTTEPSVPGHTGSGGSVSFIDASVV
jgi:hypothetical protein